MMYFIAILILLALSLLLLKGNNKKTSNINHKKIIYITYVDFDNLTSGSSVRPKKMYDAFRELDYEITLLTGLQNRYFERIKNIFKVYKEIRKSEYAYCYVEPPAGPVFNIFDHLLLFYIKNVKKVPIGLFYRDAYWKFADWYDLKGFKRFIVNTMHRFDWLVFNNTCKVIYFPSETMEELFNVKGKSDTLPPGAEEKIYIDKDNFSNKSLIYVGAVGGNNGVDLLLQAFDSINSNEKLVNLTLIVREVNEDIKKYLDKEWLKVATGVSGIDMLSKYYEEASYAVIPRKIDLYMDFAVPIKLYEYISFGIPIISTNCKEIAKILKGNNLGLVAEDNVESLGDIINKAFEEEEYYKEYKKNLKEYVSNNNWKARIEKVESTLL